MVVLLYASPSLGRESLPRDACSLQNLFTRKLSDATRKAIGMPEAAIDQYSLEITDRVGDTTVLGVP